MTGAMYGYKAPTAPRGAFGSSAPAIPPPPVANVSPMIQNVSAPAPSTNGSSEPTYDMAPALFFAASSLACYFDVPYSSLLLLIGAAATAYAVYEHGIKAIRWWVWALGVLALYMYTAGPCSGQLMGDYERGAALLGYE